MLRSRRISRTLALMRGENAFDSRIVPSVSLAISRLDGRPNQAKTSVYQRRVVPFDGTRQRSSTSRRASAVRQSAPSANASWRRTRMRRSRSGRLGRRRQFPQVVAQGVEGGAIPVFDQEAETIRGRGLLFRGGGPPSARRDARPLAPRSSRCSRTCPRQSPAPGSAGRVRRPPQTAGASAPTRRPCPPPGRSRHGSKNSQASLSPEEPLASRRLGAAGVVLVLEQIVDMGLELRIAQADPVLGLTPAPPETSSCSSRRCAAGQSPPPASRLPSRVSSRLSRFLPLIASPPHWWPYRPPSGRLARTTDVSIWRSGMRQ